MMMGDDPFGGLPQFGQQQSPMGMAGPTGFAGPMGLQQDPMKKKKQGGMFGGMNPMFGLAGMMGPKILPFLLGGLGGGGLFSLLSGGHHNNNHDDGGM